MTTAIDTHSVLTSLIQPGGWALDVGCRGFGFAKVLASLGCRVLALDPDPAIVPPDDDRIVYECRAVVGADQKDSIYARFGDGCANHLCTRAADLPGYAEGVVVPCVTIADLMKAHDIEQFEVIKLDCEGSEYAILDRIAPGAAKQITVEFHDFLGFNPRTPDNERWYAELFAGPFGREYETVKHERTPLNGNGPLNYWDSLFVRRQ